MNVLGFLLLLSATVNAGINKLFFSGQNIHIDCPGEAMFYQWKKYFSGEVTILLSEDKRRIQVPLNAEKSPITYQCSGTNGFVNTNENITIFVLDQESTEARKLCSIKKSGITHIAQYPCFLYYQRDSMVRVARSSAAVLNCEAGGTDVTYIWYKLNTPKSHQELLEHLSNSPVLKIDSLDEIAAGQYLCIVNTTTGDNLKRFFDVQIFENASSASNLIVVDGPDQINVTVQSNTNYKFACKAEALEANSIHLIQWAKKLDGKASSAEGNLVIQWGNSDYKLLPDSQIQQTRQSGSSITTSLLLNQITAENAGQYVCAFFTNLGKMKHRTFTLFVKNAQPSDPERRSLLTLYILIPSLVIAVCLFLGLYLSINRMSVRKASHSGTGTTASNCCKSDTEALHLRQTPDNSVNSYPTKSPMSNQYVMHGNYPSPYYSGGDKLIL